MATHKIIVQVQGEGVTNPTEINPSQVPTEIIPPASKNMFNINGIGAAAVFNMGRSLTLGGIARIGEASGNYYLQRQVNNVMSVANYGFMIATGGIAGAAFTALDIGFKVYDFNLRKAKAEIDIDMRRQAVGLAAVSGTRYKGRKI